VIELRLKYRAPARYDDVLAVEVWFTMATGVRLNFGYQVTNQEGELILTGETLHVCTGLDEKPKRLPEFLTAVETRVTE
jgi:acyl-CoA thioester hydrolase